MKSNRDINEFIYRKIRSVTTVANRDVDFNRVDIREGSLYRRANYTLHWKLQPSAGV